MVGDFLVKLRDEGIHTIEPRRSSEEHWKQVCQDISEQMLFKYNDSSWYLGANIPGKKREQLNYVGGMLAYNQACEDAFKDWTNFDIKRKDGSNAQIGQQKMQTLR